MLQASWTEVISNSSINVHQTWCTDFSQSLYKVFLVVWQLGWVDFGSSFGWWAWWNIPNLSQHNPCHSTRNTLYRRTKLIFSKSRYMRMWFKNSRGIDRTNQCWGWRQKWSWSTFGSCLAGSDMDRFPTSGAPAIPGDQIDSWWSNLTIASYIYA